MSGGLWGGSAPLSGPERSGGWASRRYTPYLTQPKAPTKPAAKYEPAPRLSVIDVVCKLKSWKTQVSWEWASAPQSMESWRVTTVETAAQKMVDKANLPSYARQRKLRVKPGTWYKVFVEAFSEAGAVLARGQGTFKSVFDREELLRLYDKCFQFAGLRLERFRVFYRHKPEVYWNNIASNRNNVMEKYIKDMNGQEASPINDAIYGLFFSANLVKGGLPRSSPFGDVRMHFPAPMLFTPRHKLYFADFYCNATKSSTARKNTNAGGDKTSAVHYMTVVVCEAGSETDGYCSKVLVPLNIHDNPFLKIEVFGPDNYQYWVNTGLWVEVYYTESVPTRWASGWETSAFRGKGAKPGGLANNKDCPVCNLYPGGVYPEEGEEEEGGREEAGPGPSGPLKRSGEADGLGAEGRQTRQALSTRRLGKETEEEGVREAGPTQGKREMAGSAVSPSKATVGPRASGSAGFTEASWTEAAEEPQTPRNVVEITLDSSGEEEAVSGEGGWEARTKEGAAVLRRLAAAETRLDKIYGDLDRKLSLIAEYLDSALEKQARFSTQHHKTK